MEYQYIENGNKKLYSVYYEPQGRDSKEVGIIMCYPIGQEYIRCHKLYVTLAKKIAEHGFHVLRFDYSGTGDSYGEFSSFSIEQAIEDIDLAVKELKEACGLKKIMLVGVRLGATLSLLYSQKAKIDGLILWNPIFDGIQYLKELDYTYEKWLSGSFTKEKRDQEVGLASFGFTYSSNLINQIQSICINKNYFPIEVPILLIDDDIDNDFNNSTYLFFEKSINKEYWLKRVDELNKSMVPIYELNKTIDWLINTNQNG